MDILACQEAIRRICQDEIWDILIDEPEPGSHKASARLVYDDILPSLEVEVWDIDPEPVIELPGGKTFEMRTSAKCWVRIPKTDIIFPIGAEGGSFYFLDYLENYRKKNSKEVA